MGNPLTQLIAENVYAVEVLPDNGVRQFMSKDSYATTGRHPRLWATRAGAQKAANTWIRIQAKVVEFKLTEVP